MEITQKIMDKHLFKYKKEVAESWSQKNLRELRACVVEDQIKGPFHLLTEEDRIERYRKNIHENAFDIFIRSNNENRSRIVRKYLEHKLDLLEAYKAHEITLLELNNDF